MNMKWLIALPLFALSLGASAVQFSWYVPPNPTPRPAPTTFSFSLWDGVTLSCPKPADDQMLAGCVVSGNLTADIFANTIREVEESNIIQQLALDCQARGDVSGSCKAEKIAMANQAKRNKGRGIWR